MQTKKVWFGLLLILSLAFILASYETDDGETGTGSAEVTPTPTAGVEITPMATPQEPVSAIPPEVEQFAAEWPMANKDYGNTRATTDSGINSKNVHELGIAWAFDIPGVGSYGGGASNPLIADEVVYFQDLASNVFAIDLETGDLIWENMIDEVVLGPNGPAIGWGKVFVQGGVNSIKALDRHTGELIWNTTLEGPTGAQQPYVWNGYVFTTAVAGAVIEEAAEDVASRRGYAPGNSGHIYALNQGSGVVVWGWQVIEEGFWGNVEINSGGGVWFPPAIDTNRGVTYWGTGNPAPFPGIRGYPNAASRPGPNL